MLFLDATASSTSYIAICISIVSALTSIGAIWVGAINTRRTLNANTATNERNLQAKNNEDRKQEIYKTLNDFYGPFEQLRAKSRLLYDKFAIGKDHNTEDQQRFSTLLYLLKNGTKGLSSNDIALLKEIIDIGSQCEKLIAEKSGLIDDNDLRRQWLPQASRHYLLIRLAYNGALTGDEDLYRDSTFQHEIDRVINHRINALRAELQQLNN